MSIAAPDFNAPMQAIPLSPGTTLLATGNFLYILGILLVNTTNAQHTVRITDGAGATIVPDIAIPAKTPINLELPFMMKVNGLIWFSDIASGVQGQVEGYTTWPF